MRDIIVILTNADNVISRREMNGQLFRTSMKMALRHFSKQPLPHTVSSGMDFPRKPPPKMRHAATAAPRSIHELVALIRHILRRKQK